MKETNVRFQEARLHVPSFPPLFAEKILLYRHYHIQVVENEFLNSLNFALNKALEKV